MFDFLKACDIIPMDIYQKIKEETLSWQKEEEERRKQTNLI